jgi:hypothetical protein
MRGAGVDGRGAAEEKKDTKISRLSVLWLQRFENTYFFLMLDFLEVIFFGVFDQL